MGFVVLVVVLGGILTPNVAFGETIVTWADSAEKCIEMGYTPEAKPGGGYNCVSNTNLGDVLGVAGDVTDWALGKAFAPLFQGIGYLLMTLTGGILTLVGILFDTVVQFTIVDMAEHLGEGGLGASITDAWATLRDVANMAFIFVLLFVAFKAMFKLEFGNISKDITNIIIVALLINFSLFFSKVVIDASNIVAIGFYKAIATANAAPESATASGNLKAEASITNGYMRVLGLQSWHDPDLLVNDARDKKLDARTIFIIGFMSSIFFLVTAVIFLISAIMLIARFVLLIFIMILSPLALIAYIIPGQNDKFKKWKSMLLDQAFFAPLFFALTWVSLSIAGNSKLLKAISPEGSLNDPAFFKIVTENPKGSIALVLNYVIVIGFAIVALVFAKQMANKAAGFKAISGGIGAAAVGTVGFAGRQTVGRGSQWVSENKREQWSKTRLGRAGLWMADRGASSSFDLGASKTLKKVPGLGKEMDVFGKGFGKGGFAESVKNKAKKKTEYGKRVYGLSDEEKARIEEDKQREEPSIKAARAKKLQDATAAAKKAERERRDYINKNANVVEARTAYDRTKQEKRNKEEEIGRETNEERKEALRAQLQEIHTRMVNDRSNLDEAKKDIEENDEVYIALKERTSEAEEARKAAKKQKDKKEYDKEEYSAALQEKMGMGEKRMEAYAKRLEEAPIGLGRLIGGFQGNKAAARKVRETAKGKDKKSKKELRKFFEDEGILEKPEEGSERSSEEGGDDKETSAGPKPEESTEETKAT